MSAKFYICRHCGNLVGMIHDAGVPMMCCGQKMEALEPNTVEASGESICLLLLLKMVQYMSMWVL